MHRELGAIIAASTNAAPMQTYNQITAPKRSWRRVKNFHSRFQRYSELDSDSIFDLGSAFGCNLGRFGSDFRPAYSSDPCSILVPIAMPFLGYEGHESDGAAKGYNGVATR
ncbi:hypothetical protein EVAR_101086_1 [Eumeta japonica]|uniref:Uncharacterized protein n=1 Tax=Eumeta variegata TaxID=151549 RepID=A0A4C2AE28_EUMVA|nr:hypothetical protein EVAR_101086_1 [Eumeta japonica]